MIRLLLRDKIPDISLPFMPRSAGINRFSHAGLQEDMDGIDAVELCSVARGMCEVEQQGVMVPLYAGQSLFKLPGEHRRKIVLSENGAEIYWTTFDGPRAADFMRSFGYPRGALSTGKCPAELYEEIARNLAAGTKAAFRRMIALYTELIVLLPGPEEEGEPSDLIFSECIRLIRTNFHDPEFNIDALASKMNLHRTTLLRLFRRRLNTSPLEYLTQYRIRYALDLLRTTLLPVTEIAASSGFRQCNYFCRLIRSHCGRTPQEFRNVSRERRPENRFAKRPD